MGVRLRLTECSVFTVNVGNKFRDTSWCPLNRGCLLDIWGPLDTGLTVLEDENGRNVLSGHLWVSVLL